MGYKLEKLALVFGGDTLTASDIAVAAGLVSGMGTCPDKVKSLDMDIVQTAKQVIQEMVEDLIDQVKVSGLQICCSCTSIVMFELLVPLEHHVYLVAITQFTMMFVACY